MNNRSRILTALAALLLLLLFFLPLWKISLIAPQYPDGLSMYLYINDIKDGHPGDIDNINIMNHYVGMRSIHAEDFKEFTYFPIVVVTMCALGLLAAFSANRKIIFIWVVLLAVAGTLGIYDFYLWEYDYGHNLSDEAPIKVPGQAYQPPLIGSKMLLNFNAISYPYYGAIFIGIPLICSFLSFYLKRKWTAKS